MSKPLTSQKGKRVMNISEVINSEKKKPNVLLKHFSEYKSLYFSVLNLMKSVQYLPATNK